MAHTVTRNRDTGQYERRCSCESCQMLSINGLPCHEIGCPEAWRDGAVECEWCGQEFEPEQRGQRFCDEDCARSYHG